VAVTAFNKTAYFAGSLYLLLLLFSWWVTWYFPVEDQFNRFEQTDLIQYSGESLTIHYLKTGEKRDNLPLLLLPDAYNPADNLLPLANELSAQFEVIIPVFDKGAFKEIIANEERSAVIGTWIEQMKYDSLHIAGFRYGGLIAMETASTVPEHVSGLILIQSMGIEEIHFLGNYRINRSVYSLMVPVITLFEYCVPHFGSASTFRLNRHFVSTMLAMDQRHIEEALRKIDDPVLILHSESEPQIPIQTAREIYRLVPQSNLTVVQQNPDHIKRLPSPWSFHISEFLNIVNQGTAITKSRADRDRTAESSESFDEADINELSGYALIMLIVLLILISLISEDLACIAGGLLYATGVIEFSHALFGSIAGIVSADILIYGLGRWIGNPILKIAPFRWFIKQEDIAWAKEMFDMRGAEILVATRFIPGTRLPVYLSAGLLKTSFWPFLGYFLASLAVWAPLLIWVTSLIGYPMLTYIDAYQEYALIFVLTAILLIYIFIKFILPLGTVKGRRQAKEKWNRHKEKRKNPDVPE
jgi:membrane protein DedA with SNARE-associated domain/pimeloyl-ACP methyl ester carboxylesterase